MAQWQHTTQKSATIKKNQMGQKHLVLQKNLKTPWHIDDLFEEKHNTLSTGIISSKWGNEGWEHRNSKVRNLNFRIPPVTWCYKNVGAVAVGVYSDQTLQQYLLALEANEENQLTSSAESVGAIALCSVRELWWETKESESCVRQKKGKWLVSKLKWMLQFPSQQKKNWKNNGCVEGRHTCCEKKRNLWGSPRGGKQGGNGE